MVEDMFLSGNEMIVPLGLTLSVEVTDMLFRVPLYEVLSLSVHSKVPQPSMVLF